MKKCVFCHRSPPEVKISNEHVLRAKLSKLLPSKNTKIFWEQKFASPNSGKITEKQRNLHIGPFDFKVNDICEICNSGWLSKSIEIPSEKYIEAAILGTPIDTTVEARHFIALWAAKTAAVRGLMDQKPRGVPEEHYTWIKENLTPPPGTFVWLGKSQNTPLGFTRHLRFTLFHPTGTSTHHHMSMLNIGYMILFVLGCTSEENVNLFQKTINQLDSEQLIRIWPNGVTNNTSFLPEMSKEHIYRLSSAQLPFSDTTQHIQNGQFLKY